MKLYKSILASLLMASAAVGFTACNDNFDCPPVIFPEQVGNGTSGKPYDVNTALTVIYGHKYTTRNVYVQGIVSQIEADFNPSYGNITYYISNDGTTEYQLEIYRGLGLNGDKFTSVNDLKIGDEVIVYCQLTYYNDSVAETQQGAVIVSINGSEYPKVDAPDPSGDGSAATPFNVMGVLDYTYSPEFVDGIKVYMEGIVSRIDASSFNASFGNINYYISDSGQALDEFYIYRGLGLDGAKFTSANDIKIGDKVVVYGPITLYNGSVAETKQGAYIVSLNDSPYDQTAGGGVNSGDQGDTPAADAETIYTGLAGNMDGWLIEDVLFSNVWSWKEYNGSTYLNGSAYAGGGANASEAYAYTTVDLKGYKTVSVNFDHAAKFQTTLRDLCGFVVRVNGSTEWTKLAIPTWPEAGSWSFANSGAINLDAYAGKKVDLGFVYKSTTAGADTWEIKNFKVLGTK